MKRFFFKLGRFFWSWGFLKFILWTATLIIFFYVEEDWRGARAWAATKAEWEAKGETFDFNKLIPPSIPDDQNLGAISLFKLEPYSKIDSHLHAATLERALRDGLPGNDIPRFWGWQEGELPHMEEIRRTIATNYATAFQGTELPKDTLAQFEALYPFLTDLRNAAAVRPYCRLPMDDRAPCPAGRSLGPVIAQLKLSKILTLHAILALDNHQPDLALADLKTVFTLMPGVKRDPSLVGGLVALAMTAFSETVIYDGLTLHAWNDAQLAEIQQMLQPLNFLANYQFAMRSEAIGMGITIDWIKNQPRSILAGFFYGTETGPDKTIRLYSFWPVGWLDENKSHHTTSILNSVDLLDPKLHRAFPERADRLQNQALDFKNQWYGYAPWNILATMATSPILAATIKFAEAQVWVDETRIACALERYRLAHGVYPELLDTMVPTYIDDLPHDIINGEPYHYKLKDNGTFLLYSVGWNQKDDGGKVVYEKESPTDMNIKEGDWVWPMSKVDVRKSQ